MYERLAKMGGRGHLHCLTVFIRHENVMRLLKFPGYRQEEYSRGLAGWLSSKAITSLSYLALSSE
jgi:hypothetical protein